MKELLAVLFFVFIFAGIFLFFKANMQCAESGGMIMRGAFGGFGCMH